MSCRYSDWFVEARQIGFELLRKRKRHSAIPQVAHMIAPLVGDRNPISVLIPRYR